MTKGEFIMDTNVIWEFVKTLQDRFPTEEVKVDMSVGSFRRSTVYGVLGTFDEDHNTEEN